MIYETIFLHKNEQLQKDKYIAIKPAIIMHHSSDKYIQFLQRKFWNKIFYIGQSIVTPLYSTLT